MRSAVVVCLLAASSIAHAGPACHLRGRPWLEARVQGSKAAAARAVDARLGEAIEVFLVAPGQLDGRAVLFSELPGRGRVSWTSAGCGPMTVAWKRVEPRMEHVDTPAPNKTAKVYSNAVVFGPDHGKWIGFDKLEYFESPVASSGDGARLIVRDATPSGSQDRAGQRGLGTMRLCATLEADGQSLATPGAGDAPEGQISPRVLRYSFRSSDGFLGWLTSYFNVPYLFGSAGKGTRNQAERYIGADCADILVAALRRAGASKLEYTSVAELVDSMSRVAGPSLVKTTPAEPAIRFGAQVRAGDLIALDYVGFDGLPRSWDHIVVMVEDRGPDGKPDGLLGPEDLVADSGDSSGLKFAPLADQGTVRVQVLRPSGVPVL